MTERELFREFYRIARICAPQPERIVQVAAVVARAERAGLGLYRIHKCRMAALCAALGRMQPRHEPSKNSAAIQCLVHTFGRVTKGVA